MYRIVPVKESFYIFRTGAILIEDCAASLGTHIQGQPAGSFGDYAFFSFDSITVDRWENGVVTSAVSVGKMIAWAKHRLKADPTCFIAGIR